MVLPLFLDKPYKDLVVKLFQLLAKDMGIQDLADLNMKLLLG